jgi:5-methyltetrahydrofolate--homocysteine methyltransferase
MLVVGESINATNRAVGEAITSKDRAFLEELARAQAAAGADYIDVNVGTGRASPEQEIADMEWLIEVVQTVTDRPLTIDSDNPQVIAAGLRRYRGQRPMINSVNAEAERLSALGHLAMEHDALLVALTMGSGGIPDTIEERLDACDRIMEGLSASGVAPERILFDPLVLPISVDPRQGVVTLRTLEQIKSRYPDAGTFMGLSNISYGLPQRKVINRSFLLMAAYAGLDAVIMNALDTKMMGLVKVAEMLTGADPRCKGYLKAHRRGAIVD